MDLTNEDVTDILALLDSLPYDELDLQTTRFRLVLRRTPDGWTQSVETRSAPEVLDAAPPDASPGPSVATPFPQATPAAAPGLPSTPATSTMEHRAGYNRLNVASSRSGSGGGGAGGAEAAAGGAEAVAGGAEAAAGGAEAAAGGAEAGSGTADAAPELVAVRAPLPGTFYRAPRPGAAPFVEVGSRVDPDTVVGIVETMKLMNSVTAGVPGTVAEICLGNAEFAAHGAALLRIRAD